MRLALFTTLCFFGMQSYAADLPTDASLSLSRLLEGNQRFANGIPEIKEVIQQRKTLKEGQAPFAVILGCSDSRVGPEVIFDQGLGEIFVVRVAGNVMGGLELDSILYATVQLQAPLILVLGHQSCGAVAAVLQGKVLKVDLEEVAPLIQPAVERTKGLPGDRLTNTIKENVKLVVERLKSNPEIVRLMQENKVAVVGGYYNFSSGLVEILKD